MPPGGFSSSDLSGRVPADRAARGPPVAYRLEVPIRPGIGSLLLAVALAAAPRPAAAATSLGALAAQDSPRVRYRSDAFVLRLSPDAARAARAAIGPGASRGVRARLGLAGADEVAGDLGGVAFEPEFPGELAPPPGSTETDFTTFYIVHLPPGVQAEAALGRFRALAGVERVTPIAVTALTGLDALAAVPDDSLWSASYHLYQPSRRDDHALEAWSLTTGDSSTVVAILDSGVLLDHPDLGGTTAGLSGNLWINWAERGGTPGVDDDGNGYVDDVMGWDFVSLPSPILPSDTIKAGEDWRDADDDPNDFSSHGTAVAGIVAGLTNNRIGIAGAAPGVRIMPLRVAYSTLHSPLGDVDLTFAAQALRYATRMGASVINMSFSTDPQDDFEAALEAAIRAGVTIVFAAGNNGISSYYTLRSDVIAVGATDANDIVTPFSNRGPQLDLCAAGYELPATIVVHAGPDSIGLRQPGYVVGASGTSFAAPQVAAAAALVQSHRKATGLRPLTPLEMMFRLRDTADDISALNAGGGYGTGRLNLFRALTDPPASLAVRAGAVAVGPAVVLPTLNGHPRVVFATSDAHLLFLDGTSGDTMRVVPLSAPPTGAVAAADLGGGRGTALFVATEDGRVAGLDAVGDSLPGWPVAVGLGISTTVVGGPALGDLDGDGRLEVVAGTTDGTLWAWRADGTPLPGFPIAGLGVSQPVALTPIDAAPGAEILVVSGTTLHAIRYDGSEAPGWPVGGLGLINIAPPVVTATGPDRMPTVFVTKPTGVLGIGADASLRMTFPLVGVSRFEPAVGDLNLDGLDELVCLLPSNYQMVVLDPNPATSGGFPGWPWAMLERPLGSPVLAHVAPGATPDVLTMMVSGLVGLDAHANTLARFPPPLYAGVTPTVADVDDDGAAEVVAGSTGDSLLVIVDAGPGTWNEPVSPWPTLRGNAARTGSRLYAPPIALVDDTPPAPVADLSADSAGAIAATLHWTAPALPNGSGAAALYEVRAATTPLTAANFSLARLDPAVPPPAPGGTPQRFRVTTLTPDARNWIALRTRDRAGVWSALSNVVSVVTGPIVPPPVADLRVAAATDTSLELTWTATAGEGGLIRPARYEIRAAGSPIDEAGFDQAPIAWTRAASAPPGGAERVSVGGLAAARDYWLAVRAVDAGGHRSPIATVAGTRTDVGGPLRGRPGVAVASRTQPARAPIDLYWRGIGGTAAGRQGIELFDLQGRVVRRIPLGTESDGIAQWNGRDQDGRLVPAGIYFARLTSGSVHAQARVVLLP